MKIKYLLPGLLTALLVITGCQDPDDLVRTNSENVTTLTIKGRLVSDETKDYDAIVDVTNKLITIQVPYYISDTQEIQGDLTQMRLVATLPVGSTFEPSIAGIHDLSEGFKSTLVNEDGTKNTYTFKAAYVKSKLASIISVTLTDFPRATLRVEEPKTQGETGKIIIYKTTSSLDPILPNARLQIQTSPWASTDIDIDTRLDLTTSKEITITAQDGITKKKYATEISTPEFVPMGQIGYMTLLFGFQVTQTNPLGFKATENRSLAVTGDYLIVGSVSKDFIVFNRYSGAKLDKKVNTTGLMADNVFHAITSDDNGVLVAVTFAAVNNQYVNNNIFEIYAWKNGIENAPTKIYSKNVATDADFSQVRNFTPTATYDLGRTVAIKGSIVSGTAQLMTASYQKFSVIRIKIVNGEVSGTPIAESEGLYSTWQISKPIPLTTDDVPPYVIGSSNYRKVVQYIKEDRSAITFDPQSNWWGSDTKGLAYTEFNGIKMVAVQNGNYDGSGVDAYNRLCIENINSMTSNAFNTSQIVDFRLQNYDPAVAGFGGKGGNATITGMTSFYVSGDKTVGTNPNKTGDICFGHSADGTAVQVYMLTTDHGLIAYELTKFDMGY